MITLFKKRKFNDYLNDTFEFFKKDGKHFFGTYFTVNGIPLLILTVSVYFIAKIYFEVVFSSLNNQAGTNENYAENFFTENFETIVFGGISFTIITLLLTLVSFAFPIIYLNEYEKRNGTNFSTKEILKGLKEKTGRILLFFFLSLIVIAPILIIIFAILIALCFIIIGFPLLMLAIPTLFSLMSLSLYHYLNNEDGFFSAIGKAFSYVFKQYWPVIGSTVIMHILTQIAMTILTMIPYVITLIVLFTAAENRSETDVYSSLGITMTIIFVFTTLLNFVFNNLLMVNQGMIYYSWREHIENKLSFYEIDNIGNHFE